MAIRYISMDSFKLWSGDMGMKREGKNKEFRGKILKMGVKDR